MADGDRGVDRVTRIYVGNLPDAIKVTEVEELFYKYGTIVNIDVKRTVSGAPFAFIEYQDTRDAEDAIKGRNGYNADGRKLRVEIPFSARGPNFKPNRGPPKRGEYRVIVSNLPPSGSWQDVKDHMREAGECVFADVYRDGTGVVEFTRREHMKYALRTLDESKFKSHEGEVSYIRVRPSSEGRGGSRSRSPRGRSFSHRRSPSPRGGPRGRSFSPRRSFSRGRSYSR